MGTKFLISLEFDEYDENLKKYCHNDSLRSCYENQYKNADEALTDIFEKYSSIGRKNIKINWIKEIDSTIDVCKDIAIPFLYSQDYHKHYRKDNNF